MRIASYNIEWMNGLFDNGKLTLDNKPSSRENLTRYDQAQALNTVFRAVDADIWMILEAPNEYEKLATKRQLEQFARHFGLRTNRARSGYRSTTDQEIAVLYDPSKISVRFRPRRSRKAPCFDHEFTTTIGEETRSYKFSRPPLELEVQSLETGHCFSLIGCHFKTKAPHGAKNDEEAVRIGFENRRKQIAQARWLRARVETIRRPLVVVGDFNDGPGCDEFEQVLGFSSIDILCKGGLLYDPSLNNAEKASTARFLKREDNSYIEALLDYAFVNPQMRPFAKAWRIWHPLHDKAICQIPKWQDALLGASDHFPISLDLDFKSPHL